MRGSLIIVAFFVAGIIVGLTHVLPPLRSMGNVSYITLCALIFMVGFTIGNDTEIFKKFKRLNRLYMLLPLMTIVGTLAGCAITTLLLPHRSLADCLAVGSGMGYYSLSSVLITQYRGADLGTVALLANIVRELFTLLGAPLMVQWFGKLAPISVGGATTMDTTLPILTRACGNDMVIVSIFHGFIVDFSVPFLVTFFSGG
ncbi:MAG: lysine exporter LysO family protein [Muribaculaceae bacterium]|nr:lysine exporter LysO family protein [Muribaculaceae bacterium]MBQ3911005.1 lysine exporter LysO family protein [Muribaculaceae bacterium]